MLDHTISPSTPTYQTKASTGRVKPVRRKRARKRDHVLEQPDVLEASVETLMRRCACSAATVEAARRIAREGLPREITQRELIIAQPDLGEIPPMEMGERLGLKGHYVREVMRQVGIKTPYSRALEEREQRKHTNIEDKLMQKWGIPDGWLEWRR